MHRIIRRNLITNPDPDVNGPDGGYPDGGYMRIDGAKKPLGPEEGMGSTGCLAFVKEVDPDSSAQT